MEKKINTIVLCMIVKNESKIIQRCLNTMIGVVDYVCITDTGSTDDTVELIYMWGKDNNIPTVVCCDSFVNFGVSRSKSIENCVREFPDAVYALHSDADMNLEVLSTFKKEDLTADCYRVMQYNTTTKYSNVRITKLQGFDWWCRGVTHEFWTTKEGTHITLEYTGLLYDDRNDGGCKSDKFERDIRLLTEALETETDQFMITRYMFYLAQSYKCIGDFDNAIKWYTKRTQVDHFSEEIFMAYKAIGEIYQSQGKLFDAIGCYFQAWNAEPRRNETLLDASKCYRLFKNKQLIALMLAIEASMYRNTTCSLFLDMASYKWKSYLEIFICGTYVAGRIPEFKDDIYLVCRLCAKYIEDEVNCADSEAKLVISKYKHLYGSSSTDEGSGLLNLRSRLWNLYMKMISSMSTLRSVRCGFNEKFELPKEKEYVKLIEKLASKNMTDIDKTLIKLNYLQAVNAMQYDTVKAIKLHESVVDIENSCYASPLEQYESTKILAHFELSNNDNLNKFIGMSVGLYDVIPIKTDGLLNLCQTLRYRYNRLVAECIKLREDEDKRLKECESKTEEIVEETAGCCLEKTVKINKIRVATPLTDSKNYIACKYAYMSYIITENNEYLYEVFIAIYFCARLHLELFDVYRELLCELAVFLKQQYNVKEVTDIFQNMCKDPLVFPKKPKSVQYIKDYYFKLYNMDHTVQLGDI